MALYDMTREEVLYDNGYEGTEKWRSVILTIRWISVSHINIKNFLPLLQCITILVVLAYQTAALVRDLGERCLQIRRVSIYLL